MRGQLHYSICWEDTEIIAGLTVAGSRVLTVASAGCTSLAALSSGPSEVSCVDTNAAQISLCKIKFAAYAKLDYEHCMHLLGTFDQYGPSQTREDALNRCLPWLDDTDRRWIELNRKRFANGLIHAGKFERYLYFFSTKLLPLVCDKQVVENFMACTDLAEQRTLFEKGINTWRYRLLFCLFFSRFVMARFGRHPELLKHVSEDPASVFMRRMRHAWCEVPVKENYFMRLMLKRQFQRDLRIPVWADEQRYDTIAGNIGKISCHHLSMTAFLKTNDRLFDLIYLSDITETMSEREAEDLFFNCRKRISAEGKLVVWNNLLVRKPTQGWWLDRALSDAYNAQRKVSFYGFMGIYRPA